MRRGTLETIKMSSAMLDAGADAVLVIAPSYYVARMSEEALASHFHAIAKAIAPRPMILYNMPANTGIDMSAKLIVELSRIENIIGVKDSGGNMQKFARICEKTDASFQLLAGSAGFLFPALAVGAVGGICALANCCPQECIGIVKAFESGDLETARKLQWRMAGPNMAVTSSFGVAGMKFAMDLMGWLGGRCRLPLLPLTEKEEMELKSIFTAAGLC